MNKKIWILVGAVILLVISFKFSQNQQNNNLVLAPGQVAIGSTVIKVDIADTEAKREQGLSGRVALKDDEGMLFIFETPAKYAFWMKDMKFAIDMVWIDQDKRIVGVEKRATPESYPASFTSPKEVKYVLELPSGFYDTHDLKLGQIVSIGQ